MSQFNIVGDQDHNGTLFSSEEIEALMRLEFERSERYGLPVAVMMIEVDRLSQVQGLHGYQAGVDVVGELVGRIKSSSRAADLLAAMRGDRLLAMFPHTTARNAKDMAERFLEEARGLEFQTGAGWIRFSLSIGLASNEGRAALSFDTMTEVAGEGLAVASASGGNRWAETELYGLVARTEEASQDGTDETPSYRESLERLVEGGMDFEGAVASLVEEILLRVAQEAAPGVQAVTGLAGQGDQEVDLLRRRIAKLTESLGVSEHELGRLKALHVPDEGVSSEYREVQGLNAEEGDNELKRELMAEIFKANLDLKRSSESAPMATG